MTPDEIYNLPPLSSTRGVWMSDDAVSGVRDAALEQAAQWLEQQAEKQKNDAGELPFGNMVTQEMLFLVISLESAAGGVRALKSSPAVDPAYLQFAKDARATCPACRGGMVENEIVTFKDPRGVNFHKNKRGNGYRDYVCLADDMRIESPAYSRRLNEELSK